MRGRRLRPCSGSADANGRLRRSRAPTEQPGVPQSPLAGPRRRAHARRRAAGFSLDRGLAQWAVRTETGSVPVIPASVPVVARPGAVILLIIRRGVEVIEVPPISQMATPKALVEAVELPPRRGRQPGGCHPVRDVPVTAVSSCRRLRELAPHSSVACAADRPNDTHALGVLLGTGADLDPHGCSSP
jgi:hypothetical protein